MSREDGGEKRDSESEKKVVQAVGFSRVDLYWRKYLREREKNGLKGDLEKEYVGLIEGIDVCLTRLKDRIDAVESFTYSEEEAVRSEVSWNVKKVLEMYDRLEERLDELLKWIDAHAILG